MKKVLLGTTIAVFTAVTLTAGIASARGHGEGGQCRPELTFAALDTDGNGALTVEEMTAKAMEKFASSDANDDGFLSAEEILAAGQARMEEQRANAGGNDNSEGNTDRAGRRAERAAHMIEHLIERKDTNGDGLLSVEEMTPENATKWFEEADTDSNGEISEAEFDVFKEMHGGEARDGKGSRNCDNG